MPLRVDAGVSSRQGRRPRNEDHALAVTPATGVHQDAGALLAVADGVGGFPDGEGASAAAVASLRESYYAAPETWGLEHTLREGFTVANQAVRTSGGPGRATTLSALALRHRHYAVAHLGDSRVYLLREGALTPLTRDHRLPHADIGSVITRACGLDDSVNVDTGSGDLTVGDVFALVTDGIHEVLDDASLRAVLGSDLPAEQLADTLTESALVAGSQDNASAVVVRIASLPPETEADLRSSLAQLPIGPLPEIGAVQDGYEIRARLHRGRMSALLLAVDTENGETVALKFPFPQQADDPAFVDFFLREEWLGRRLDSPNLVRTLTPRPGRRSQLYSVLAYHSGETLSERIRRRRGLSVRAALGYARQLLTALDHLHRRGIIHRDVKPDNILIDETNRLRLLDLGVSRIERLDDTAPAVAVGTPSYMAPELFASQTSGVASDIYAAGVTLYEMLTERYPYGEVEAFSHPRFSRFVPPERYNPDVPRWLSEVLRRACAVDPAARYADATEFLAALTAARADSPPPARRPLLERIPPRYWKLLFALSLIVNMVLLVFLLS